jgi:radical SAM family uncharacterized protein
LGYYTIFVRGSESLWEKIEEELVHVSSPSQYIGTEYNSIRKDHAKCDIKFALAYPDTYKIGMSSLGLQIIYGLINQLEGVLCERIFAPAVDMEERMRKKGIELFSLESHLPARRFDIIGFSLQSELTYTNLLNMLDLAGIALFSSQRTQKDPLIIAGGCCAFYPEPIAEFIDIFLIGDGEAILPNFIQLYRKLRSYKLSREKMLSEFARNLPGAYVPSLYKFEYSSQGRIHRMIVREEAPRKIEKIITPSLDESYFPTRPVVPFAEVVHDRINLEIMRGCPHRCRFCQAVNIKNRLRLRSVQKLLKLAEELYKNTGYNEIALSSLSSGDYPDLQELMVRLNARFKPRGVSISLPSLRIDQRLRELPRMIRAVRKSGFTLAPETARESLRELLRKPLKDEVIFDTIRSAVNEGWRHVKFYFMIGLPGEEPQDIDAIIDISKKVSLIGKELTGRALDLNLTISPFVPKPHTPFQWFEFAPLEVLEEKIDRLKMLSRKQNIALKIHDPKKSLIESILSRGDRRVSNVLFEAFRLGCKFDEWVEFFDYQRWQRAFELAGIDPIFYTQRLDLDQILPWDHIEGGISKQELAREFEEVLSTLGR